MKLFKENTVNEKFNMWSKDLNKIQKKLNNIISPNSLIEINKLNKIFEDFREISNRILTPEFLKILENFPVRLRDQVSQLAEHGWFIDPAGVMKHSGSTLGDPYDAFITSGNNNVLIKYFKDRLETIEQSVIEKFPKRGHLIKSAFKAHRKKEYELSIPVFFAQIDGICTENFGGEFFRQENKKPKTAKYVQNKYKEGQIMWALMFTLIEPNILHTSKKDRQKNKLSDSAQDIYSMNRHAVLHGESLNYGTEINGLKAISLINYVTHILK